MDFIKQYFWVFFVSMLPIIELRGAIPIAAGMGLPFGMSYLVAVIGNILPVPVIIFFAKKVLDWFATFKKVGPFFQRIIDKANEKAKKLGKFELIGLFLFVAIPLPGTGAWTGSLIAAVLRMRIVPAMTAIILGVMTSGIIMGLLSFGFAGFLSQMFGG